MFGLQCPYCDGEIDDPDDCYEPGVDYEQECPHCEKNFVFGVDYIRTYSANKAECLNGGSHTLKERKRYGIGPEPITVMYCADCGYEVPNAPGKPTEVCMIHSGRCTSTFARDLVAQQVPLGHEFSSVLSANLWDLYVTDGEVPNA